LARPDAEDRSPAGREREQAEDCLDQRRLAGAVGPENGHELAALHGQRDVAPDRPAPYSRGGAVEDDGRGLLAHRAVAFASAAASARSWCTCQAWKLADAGVGVSVTV